VSWNLRLSIPRAESLLVLSTKGRFPLRIGDHDLTLAGIGSAAGLALAFEDWAAADRKASELRTTGFAGYWPPTWTLEPVRAPEGGR